VRTLLYLANLLTWLVCGALVLWIAVRLHPDPQSDTPVFGAADGTIGVIVIGVFLLGGAVLLVIPHEGIHRVCYWLFTGERPSVSRPGGHTYIAPPGHYLPKRLFLLVALAPLIVWSFVIVVTLIFVPAPTIYWLAVALALNLAICTTDLAMITWAFRQPRDALFNDQGLVVIAYALLLERDGLP
jgi:hypothetical protein